MVSVLGGVLHEQIAGGLESDRLKSATSESLSLTTQAQNRWDNSTSTSVDDLDQAAIDIMSRILTEPGPQPSRYVIMNRFAGNDSDVVLANRTSGALDLDSVSPELQAATAASPGRQRTQMSEVHHREREPSGGRRRQRRRGAQRRRLRPLLASTRWSRRWRRWG